MGLKNKDCKELGTGGLVSIVSFNSVSTVKELVGAFNQEKALVGAFSVVVKTDGSILLQL